MRRWLPLGLALVAVALVPWTIWLTTVLPSHEVVRHWDVAWAGLDVMLATALAATAVSAWRRGPLLQACAASAGTLLVLDAWFDLLTSPGKDLVWAIVLACVGELPLALVCLWIVIDTERFRRRLAAWRSYKAEPQASASARSRP